MSYLVPKSLSHIELEIKKSRFIAFADYTVNRQEAMALVDKLRKQFPDARHHCWAYSLGSPSMPESAAMDDDGEPSGTAGKPIYNVISHKNIGDITIVVVRYFGGIKLGAGGLVRAYSAAAQAVIDALPTVQLVNKQSLLITTSFSNEQFIRQHLDKYDGRVVSVDYKEQVQLIVELPEASVSDWQSGIASLNDTEIRNHPGS